MMCMCLRDRGWPDAKLWTRRWNDVSYISMPMVCILCTVAYPAVLVGGLLGMTVSLGLPHVLS